MVNFLEMRNKLLAAGAIVSAIGVSSSCRNEQKKPDEKAVLSAPSDSSEFYLSDLEICENNWDHLYQQEICVRDRVENFEVGRYFVPELVKWQAVLKEEDIKKEMKEDIKLRVLLTVAEYSGQCKRVKKEVDCIDEVRYLLLKRGEDTLQNNIDVPTLYMYFYVLDSLINGGL